MLNPKTAFHELYRVQDGRFSVSKNEFVFFDLNGESLHGMLE